MQPRQKNLPPPPTPRPLRISQRREKNIPYLPASFISVRQGNGPPPIFLSTRLIGYTTAKMKRGNSRGQMTCPLFTCSLTWGYSQSISAKSNIFIVNFTILYLSLPYRHCPHSKKNLINIPSLVDNNYLNLKLNLFNSFLTEIHALKSFN